MLSPEQKLTHEEREQRAKTVARAWLELQENPAIEDLLTHIDTLTSKYYALAVAEVDNPYKAQAHLQAANAYDTIRAYIRKKLV